MINRRRVKKHFQLVIEDNRFEYSRNQEQITQEAALDGFYVLRTNPTDDALTTADVVRSYKQLAHAERAFRALKGPELELRPVRHRREGRVRAHAFLCLLAYYLEWHLRAAWAPLLFSDEQPPLAADPVAKAERSPAAKRKASTHKTTNGDTCHSFTSLLTELAPSSATPTASVATKPPSTPPPSPTPPRRAPSSSSSASRNSRSHEQDSRHTPPSTAPSRIAPLYRG